MTLSRWIRFRLVAGITITSVLLAPAGTADLFGSTFTRNSVRRFDENSGAFLGTFINAGLGGLSAPHRGRFGPDGSGSVGGLSPCAVHAADR